MRSDEANKEDMRERTYTYVTDLTTQFNEVSPQICPLLNNEHVLPAAAPACYNLHMSRIWAKTVTNFKVKDSIIHECPERLDSYNFFENTRAIAEKLHVPTPVVLDSHCRNFMEFNTLKFRPRDFLEPVHFDFLVFESAD